MYDGFMYVFGKGKSATTVLAPQTQIMSGNKIVITGTILDQSPAQPGTPCVSQGSMSTQMEYLHMQHPIDGVDHKATLTGVPVSLDAVDPNGNYIHIGDTTTEGYSGTFGYNWQPEIPGQYTITATFSGDDSYGSSFATTYTLVGIASSTQTQAPQQIATPDYTLTIIGMGIAIIVSFAIGVAIILRKR
jgi:hypothetical protein